MWALATIVPNIAVSVRRLHDAGYSGWFYLFSVVGLGIVTLVLCALETSPKAAQYGPPYPDNYGQQQPYGNSPATGSSSSSLPGSSRAMGSSTISRRAASSSHLSRPAEPTAASTMSGPALPPLDWPHYGIGFLPAVKRGFAEVRDVLRPSEP